MPLLSEITFGSFLVYSPSGRTAKSQRSKVVCHAVKNDSVIALESQNGRLARVIPYSVGLLARDLTTTSLAEIFAQCPVLVPAPRSSRVKPGTAWPTRVICEEMVQRGLGSEVRNLLTRIKAVPKAAVQHAANRPTPTQHFESMRAERSLDQPNAIVLVDDVVTSGTMLLASISRLREAYPRANLHAFALVRTMSGTEIEAFLSPCVGTIHLVEGRCRRRP